MRLYSSSRDSASLPYPMDLLDQTADCLKRIDDSYASIQKLARSSSADDVKAWLVHFDHTWSAFCRQLGWAMPRSRARRLIERIVPYRFRQVFEESWFESPVWGTPGLFMSFPPECVSYPTAYGFILCSSGVDTWQMLGTGHYASELAETLFLLRAIRVADVFIDVGANLGFFLLLVASQRKKRTRVIAFEPGRANFATLERAVRENGLSGSVELHHVAVGKQTGEVNLFLCSLGSGGHRVRPTSQHYNAGREQVAVTTLDETCARAALQGLKTIVKIDVEGTEQDVFDGARTWMRSTYPPLFLFEAWPDSAYISRKNHIVLAQKLRSHGYRVFALDRLERRRPLMRAIPTRGPFRPTPSANYVALPQWSWQWIDMLNEPVDWRWFTSLERLNALETFLTRSLTALEQRLSTGC